jgi:hypothetical protein
MSTRSRQVVYNEKLPLEMAAAALDLERLRRGFAELFDRAAQAVQLAGYEQDDAAFERYLLVRTADGAEVSTKAEWLADRERLIGHIAEETQKAKTQKRASDVDLADVLIIGIRVEAVVE